MSKSRELDHAIARQRHDMKQEFMRVKLAATKKKLDLEFKVDQQRAVVEALELAVKEAQLRKQLKEINED